MIEDGQWRLQKWAQEQTEGHVKHVRKGEDQAVMFVHHGFAFIVYTHAEDGPEVLIYHDETTALEVWLELA